MCWALCLLAFREAVDDDVSKVTRRADRAAKKNRELGELLQKIPVITENLFAAKELPLNEKKVKQLNDSFGKLWSSNFLWASKALAEAVHFATGKMPRDPSSLEKRK